MPDRRWILIAALALAVTSCGGSAAVPDTDTIPSTTTTAATTTTTAPATTTIPTTTTTTTTTTTLPPEPEIGWTAWLPADPGDAPLPACRGCSGGETPLSRDPWIRILFVDEDGIVWATDDGGLLLWDPVSGSTDVLGRADGLLDDLVYEIVRAPDGLLWLATYGGANIWDGERLGAGLTRDMGLAERTTWDLWVQSDGTVWTDTAKGYVLAAFDGTEVRHFSDAATAATVGPEIEAVFPERTQFNSAMAETPDGTAWFGSNGNGLFAYDGVQWRRFTQDDGLPSDSVKHLAVTPDGTLWISAIGGLSHFDGATFTLVDPEVMGDWSGEYPDTLAVDHDGALWVMTTSSLLRHLDGDWTVLREFDGLAVGGLGSALRVIYSLVSGEDGSVWIGTSGGVARYGPLLPGA